jgi:lipoprotein NlpI
LAYLSGDLYLALVDFDLAIDLDPSFSDAYVDRGLVLYRMGDLTQLAQNRALTIGKSMP